MATVAPAPAEQDLGGDILIERRPFLERAGGAVWRFIRLQPGGTMGIIVIVIVVATAIFAPYMNTAGEGQQNLRAVWVEEGRDVQGIRWIRNPPGPDWWMGTNNGAQDLWSRVVYSSRPALMLGIGAASIAIVVATSLALLMGYMKGAVDTLLSRLIEILISIPGLIWLILFRTAFGVSIPIIMLAIAFTIAPLTTLVLRGNVIQEAASTYAESARVVGSSNLRIMFRHILPNLLPLAIVNASIIIPAAILADAGLSFLGLGDPTVPSWGLDIGAARAHPRDWWLAVFPGAALALTVLAFNFLGDSIRDTLDPRLRGSGLI